MDLLKLLDIKHREYQSMLTQIRQENLEGIDGKLETYKRGSAFVYYHRYNDPMTTSLKKRHIKKDTLGLATSLAKQEYLSLLDNLINRRLKQMKRLIQEYREDEIDQIYYRLHPGKQALIEPIVQTQRQARKIWKDKPYAKKTFLNQESIITTKKGEQVRSKSEKILADKFYDLGIDYKYECPLKLKNGLILYPDFTFYDAKKDKEIYWEHHGMMDNPSYASKAIRKIAMYEQNGLFRNLDLIVSFEASNWVLNENWINQLIDKFLINCK